MNAPRNLDRLIRTYLVEDQATGHSEVPDRVYSAMRLQIEQTHQRAVIGSRGVPDMNKFVAIGLGAAAVIVILLVGAQLVGQPNVVGPPVESATPEPTTIPSAAPSVPESPPEVGVTYAGPIPVGWTQDSVGSVPYPDDEALGFTVTQNELVMDPGCANHHDSDVGPSAGEAVEALAGRDGLEEAATTSVAVGGLDGHQLDFLAAADGTGATCRDESEQLDFVPLFGHYLPNGFFFHFYTGPGEESRLIVLDTPTGGTVWIWTFAAPQLDLADHLDTAMQVVDGLQFESP
jgi:hypothetical protein